MEPQSNVKVKSKSKKSGFFTKISIKEDAKKPIKSISTLFYFFGIINLLAGIAIIIVLFLTKHDSFILKYTGSFIIGIIFGFTSFILGLVTVIFAYQFKKYKKPNAAKWFLVFSSIGLIGSIAKPNIFALLFFLIAFFSSIDAIRILKQLDKLESEGNTEPVPDK